MPPLDAKSLKAETKSPLELVGLLGVDEYRIPNTNITHKEIHTQHGCIITLWHEAVNDKNTPTAAKPEAENTQSYVMAMGGANGGLLGPSGGLYHELAVSLAQAGAAFVRVHYRKPGRLEDCLLDVASVVDLAARSGGQKFVFIGHSFGGAVAIQAGVTLANFTSGVVTLATQSAGCEAAGRLGETPLLLVHGGKDEILDPQNSQLVASMATENAEVVIYPQAKHGLVECREELKALLEFKILGWLEISEPQ